ncbi:hypothetical protein [Actinomadura yumaensis]|uniref:Uncharacterized protein n=1 Tax=Actinomadura yumaensis TaxID=111807 RepID=A0ABW2CF55_9ACTN
MDEPPVTRTDSGTNPPHRPCPIDARVVAVRGLRCGDALSERQWCSQVGLRADGHESAGAWTADRPGGGPDGGAVDRAAVTRLARRPDVLAEPAKANAVRFRVDAMGDVPDAPHAPDASNDLDAAFAGDVEPCPGFVGGLGVGAAGRSPCRSRLVGRLRTVSRGDVGHAWVVPRDAIECARDGRADLDGVLVAHFGVELDGCG